MKLDATYPAGRTAKRIQQRFGRDGLLVWICFLTAAKRNIPEGEFVYVGDGWASLSLVPSPPFEFTLDEFLTLTGQLKQTRRRRTGDVMNVTLTHWGDWQEKWRRDDARERMSRKRRETNANTVRTPREVSANGNVTEKEKEKESTTPLIPQGGNGVVGELHGYYCTARGKTVKLSVGRRRKIEARLKEFSPDDLKRAIDAVALDPWEERGRNDDLVQIFRSHETVDRFLSFHADPSLRQGKDKWKHHFAEKESRG